MSPRREPPPLHPFLFALFPALSLFANNLGKVSGKELLVTAAALLGGTLLLLALLDRRVKDRQRAGLLASWGILLFFSYGHALDLVQGRTLGGFGIGGHRSLLPLWGVLFLLGGWLILRARRPLRRWTPAWNLAAAALVAATAWNLAAAGPPPRVHRSPLIREILSAAPAGRTPLPSIYYIVLDGYGRADYLKAHYRHDNSPFLKWLAQKGFYVAAEARANYDRTVTSLASSLNMEYLDAFAKEIGPNSENQLPLQRWIQRGRVIQFLKRRGYRIASFSSGVSATELRRADIRFSLPVGLSEFQNTLVNATPLTAAIRFFDVQRELHRLRILYAVDHLADLARVPGPLFAFVHIVCPHPPYVFGENGERAFHLQPFSFRPRNPEDYPEYARRYRDQLVFITRKIQGAIGAILARSSTPPVIVLQADHGPAFFATPEIADLGGERSAILSAYYFPEGDYSPLHPGITPVNSFRVILNRYLGTRMPLLEDRSFTSSEKGLYDFIPVPPEERNRP